MRRIPIEEREKTINDLCEDTIYSFVKWLDVYKNQTSKMICNCKIHGDWCVSVHNFMYGKRCPKCRGGVRITTEEFKEKARIIHGDKYDYSKSVYPSNNHTRMTITCRKHGDFKQTSNRHLDGSGCPKCSKYGFDSTEKSILYAMRNKTGTLIKVGITKDFKRRLRELRKHTPFDFEVIEKIKCEGETALQFENMFHREFESAKLKRFNGATEWLKWTPEIQHWLRLLSS